jgi:hypothetical protein
MVEIPSDWFAKSLISILAVVLQFFGFYSIIYGLDNLGIFAGVDALGYIAIYVLPLFVIAFTVYYIFKSDAITF